MSISTGPASSVEHARTLLQASDVNVEEYGDGGVRLIHLRRIPAFDDRGVALPLSTSPWAAQGPVPLLLSLLHIHLRFYQPRFSCIPRLCSALCVEDDGRRGLQLRG